MKKIIYPILLSFVFLISFNQSKGQCLLAKAYPYTNFWDSCSNNKGSLNAYVAFKAKSSCFKYEWTVNGNAVGGNYYVLNYKVTQNGSYDVCVKIKDTCNNCDTTICSKRSITCFSNSSTCNWASLNPYSSFWDSCSNNKASLNGYVSFKNKSCLKYQWTVNGNNAGTNAYYINYPVTQNGTYNLCLKVMDTCNNCDTTFCSSRVITCYSSNSTCNWASRYPNKYFADSCKGSSASIFGYVSFNSNLAKCFKYQWTVNGNAVSTTGTYISYNVTQNGTYNICVKVLDTCNNCDTTICSSRTITCISSGSTCNWASRYPNGIFRDSCKNTSVNLFGYISFNSNLYKCFKYQWTVNGNAVGSAQYISYTVTQNGTYNVCVKVTDTCNNCDTTICSTRTITCLGGCNWASKTPYSYVWDSCKSNVSFVNAYISFKTKGCYKYQWTVNGNNAGNGYVMKYAIFNAGTYDICVKVTDTCNNCDTTICVKYKTKCYNGIDNIALNEGINIYPNPTQGVIKLDWNKGNSSYVIYNISGQSIATGYLTNGAQTLDLSAYPTGLYILQVKAADANITKKIFLQKE